MPGNLLPAALRLALAGLLAGGLSACSVVKGWFPDKQKEYRYSSEIPPLEIPPDLIGSAPGGQTSEAPVAEDGGETAEGALADSPIGKYRPAPAGAEQTAALAQDGAGAHIVIEAPFANAWTFVGKALNRLRIEVKDKDRSQKVFYVYYSETAKPYVHRGFIDDFLSAFRGRSEDEREYRVRLEEVGDLLTKVRVEDGAGQVQSQGEGYTLLKAIHEKILTLSQPEPTEAEPEDGDAEESR